MDSTKEGDIENAWETGGNDHDGPGDGVFHGCNDVEIHERKSWRIPSDDETDHRCETGHR